MTEDKNKQDEKGGRGKKAEPGKTGWVRWWGLAVFVAVAAASTAFWFVFLDLFVKRTIEQTGTTLVGAKVELGAADVSLFPLGLTLTGLQVTDPDELMTNAVEVARVAMTLDGLNLIRRKVIVEEMAVEGVRLGTSRKTSGAVSRRSGKGVVAKLAETVSLPSLEVPDIKTIMAGADLESVKLAESLRLEVQAEQESWKKRLAELPDKAKLNDYKTRVERLKSPSKGGVAGILGAAGEAAAIQKDLERDLANIQSAKADFDAKLTSLKQRFDQA
ncbi:MAG: TIGR03545 family protein, partial [Nitrospira sp.]|nr:TIGR03545 family protein [Nitrospira sp.]